MQINSLACQANASDIFLMEGAVDHTFTAPSNPPEQLTSERNRQSGGAVPEIGVKHPVLKFTYLYSSPPVQLRVLDSPSAHPGASQRSFSLLFI